MGRYSQSRLRQIIGDRLKALRLEHGMRATDVARMSGTTRQNYHHWEAGKNAPSIDRLVALAELFGTTTDFIVGGDEHSSFNFDAARAYWATHGCQSIVAPNGSIQLRLHFAVAVEKIGDFAIRQSDVSRGVQVTGCRTIAFADRQSFVEFTASIQSKVRDYCLAEALSVDHA